MITYPLFCCIGDKKAAETTALPSLVKIKTIEPARVDSILSDASEA